MLWREVNIKSKKGVLELGVGLGVVILKRVFREGFYWVGGIEKRFEGSRFKVICMMYF